MLWLGELRQFWPNLIIALEACTQVIQTDYGVLRGQKSWPIVVQIKSCCLMWMSNLFCDGREFSIIPYPSSYLPAVDTLMVCLDSLSIRSLVNIRAKRGEYPPFQSTQNHITLLRLITELSGVLLANRPYTCEQYLSIVRSGVRTNVLACWLNMPDTFVCRS